MLGILQRFARRGDVGFSEEQLLAEKRKRFEEARATSRFVPTKGVWPYARRYDLLQEEGHTNRAPAVGSPCLVWHMGLWPSRGFGEAGREAVDGGAADGGAADEGASEATADRAQSRRGASRRETSRKDAADGALGKAGEKYEQSFTEYEAARSLFFDELNEMLCELQRRGRVATARDPEDIEKLELTRYSDPTDPTNVIATFLDVRPQSLGFTLWWSDVGAEGGLNCAHREPARSDLRVRVECQAHRDHATLSFYIDVLKPYNERQIRNIAEESARMQGARRTKIMRLVDAVRRISNDQMINGQVDKYRIPEEGVSDADGRTLLEAADYLYDDIWREFMASFGLKFVLSEDTLTSAHAKEYVDEYKANMRETDRGAYIDWRANAEEKSWSINRFTDFRGLVMSMRGLTTQSDIEREEKNAELRDLNALRAREPWDEETDRQSHRPDPRNGTIGVGDLDEFDVKSNEGNAVLKSLWPFMRRVSPWADYRSFVGCGIISMRALYMSALGSSGRFRAHDEFAGRDAEVPAEALPDRESVWDRHAEYTDPEDLRMLFDREVSRPQRYLIATKGEPHREQIGRFIERINAVGTMRLYALRNFAQVRNAGILLELLGRELDGVLQQWSKRRREIEAAHQERLRAADLPLLEPEPTPRSRFYISIFGPRRPEINAYRQDLYDARVRELSRELSKTELELIELSGELDYIGEGGSGRLLYVIDRAEAFVSQFDFMYPTLEITDVKGWISYKHFVMRGLKPTFDQIKAAQKRLVALRERLETITSTIQTSALIIEAEATRENTRTLRRIVTFFYYFAVAAIPAVLFYLMQILELFDVDLVGLIKQVF